MLVFFALGNAKVLSFALGKAKLPDANSLASQWRLWLAFILCLGLYNVSLSLYLSVICYWHKCYVRTWQSVCLEGIQEVVSSHNSI